MHEVVAGSDGNTTDLALLSTGINEEYISRSWFPANTAVPKRWTLHSTHHGKSYHVRHTYRNYRRYPIKHCTTSKSDWYWLVKFIHYHQVQTHVTYYIATRALFRVHTVHSIPWAQIIRLRVHQYNFRPPLSHSSRWVLLPFLLGNVLAQATRFL